MRSSWPLAVGLLLLVGCAKPVPPRAAASSQTASGQIVGARITGTPTELDAAADSALAAGEWERAIELLTTLQAAARVDATLAPMAPGIWARLASAYEGASRLDEAWNTHQELATRFPSSSEAHAAELHHTFLAVYLGKNTELATLGERRLNAPNQTERGRLLGLAARSIAAVHADRDVPAMRDAQDGLELAERLGVGLSGRLPLDVALLHYALAEVRRVRSERITFEGKTPTEFVPAFTARCTGLMAAQSAYTDTIRSEDPRAAILAGVSLGEVYMRVHRDVLAVPPSKKADTLEKQQIHDAMMRVRYRVLLEKGGDMMDRSLALGDKLHDRSPWMQKAKKGREAIRVAIDAEHERLKAYPFSEKEVEDALAILQKQTLAKLAAEEERQRKHWPKSE